ncbi:MAG: hypothetical protein K5928_04430 [Prevotella sp.]|nr:hypothetical protein [Prevotella sp.]
MMEQTTHKLNGKPRNVLEMLRGSSITMPEGPRTTIVPPEDNGNSVRRLVEYTDYPIETTSGRRMIRRVEKILMPNGRYRYPVTYIDMTPGFVIAPEDWDNDTVNRPHIVVT